MNPKPYGVNELREMFLSFFESKVIGVDVDQKGIIDGDYGEGMTVTSAMKGLYPTTINALTDIIVGVMVMVHISLE